MPDSNPPGCFSSMPNGPFLSSPHKTENLTGEPGCISSHLRSAAGTVISCLPFATPPRPQSRRVHARANADRTAKLRTIIFVVIIYLIVCFLFVSRLDSLCIDWYRKLGLDKRLSSDLFTYRYESRKHGTVRTAARLRS